jgi:hypothetical protein
MKASKLVILGVLLFLVSALQGQIAINVNIGTPPPWGPYGYNEVRYYYLPDIEVYYDVHTSMFIYNSGGAWIHRKYLPRKYRSYDLYGGYKVVMTDYRGSTPYTHFPEYKVKYAKGYHGQQQRSVGERSENHNSKAKSGYKEKSKGNGKSSGKGKKNNRK